jgi:hypothetical protein
VLWTSDIRDMVTKWTPDDAFESKEACEARDRERFPVRLNAMGGAEGPGIFITYKCLPDTVDPRGPKGK